MSTIFGAFDRSGKPVDPVTAVHMRTAMRHWKPDAEEMLLDGDHFLGQCLLHLRPTDVHRTTGPLRIGHATIVADARLHDRSGLLARLTNAGAPPPNGAGDAELILRLYMAGGWQALAHLRGDYAFAIFDAQARELILARDVFGVRPLFWMDRNGHLAFASEPRGILSHPAADAEIDHSFVTVLLAGLPPDPQATFHRHVRILPPGHLLRGSVFSVTLHRYIEPRIPDRMLRVSREEAQAGFRNQLQEAVRCRIDGVPLVAAELSGGLDSSAITCMAARLMPDPEGLHAFSNVLPDGHPDEEKDESPFIEAVAGHAGIRHLHRISESGRSDFRDLLDMDLEVNGGVEYMTSMWLEPVRRKMHALGIQVVLSGFMGDQVVSHSGRNHWADLADEGRLLRFLAACLKHGRPDILFGRTIKRILPESLADLLGRMRTTAPPGHSWLRKGIALHDMPSAPTTPGRFRYKRHLLWSVNRPTVARRLQNESICGIRHRIIPAYPMADLRLIEWVLSLPVSVIGHPNHDRYLFRSAMEGVLPEPVRWRRDKDVPAGVYLLQENRRFHEQVRAWVMDLRKRPGDPLLDMVDFDRILEGLDPQRTENRWQGNFYPNMPFHLQALLRYAEKQAEK